jgi:Tol biopolymer transport system component
VALLTAGLASCRSEPPPVPPGTELIAYVVDHVGADADHDIYTINPDGTGVKRLTRDSYLNRAPRWSPDGTRIAFTGNRGDYFSHLYVMRADGRRQTRLSHEGNGAGSHVWSPDGTRLAFVGYGALNSPSMIIVNADGSEAFRLPGGRSPVWSPDGRWIAFESDRTGHFEVYLMNPDGSGVRQLTDTPASGGAWAVNPVWSPDGKHLAAEVYLGNGRGNNYEIVGFALDSAALKYLTSDSADDRQPEWSPDGSRIAFLRGRDSNGLDPATSQLWVMNADGSGAIRLTTGNCDGGLGFSWSPDSRRIVFARGDEADCFDTMKAKGLWTAQVDGTGRR